MASRNGGVASLPGFRRAKVVGSKDKKLGRSVNIERAVGGFIIRKDRPYDETNNSVGLAMSKPSVAKTLEEALTSAKDWLE